MKKVLLSLIMTTFISSLSFAASKPTLLFYCGITMVKPMKEIAHIIEKQENCIIEISQGGSNELYKSLKLAKTGDLYLPGSDSYRKRYLKEGYLKDAQYIGYNQAAIFVQKGNPKHIKSLDSLIDENIATILCDPDRGSIGKMTKKILIKYKGEDFFDDVFDATVTIGSDSRNLNKALIDKRVDMAINWRASGFWKENSPFITVVSISEKYAPKKKLVLNLLSFSKHPKIAKKFMKFAASKDGQKIMKKYGFL
jgi:molybdate transport system substrate-binding protein